MAFAISIYWLSMQCCGKLTVLLRSQYLQVSNNNHIINIKKKVFNMLPATTVIKEDPHFLDPLHPNISIYFLHTVLYTFPMALTRRICLTIKSFLSWWSFPSISWPQCLFLGWYWWEKMITNHSLGLKS